MKKKKSKFPKRTIEFSYRGNKFKFSFTPSSSDEWTVFTSKGFEFDVHYDEDYKHIAVYETVDGKTNTDKTVYVQNLPKCHNCGEVATCKDYIDNGGCVGSVLACDECFGLTPEGLADVKAIKD